MGYGRFKQKISGASSSVVQTVSTALSFATLATRSLYREAKPTNRNIYSTHSGF
jgi:hypothetical protein